MLRAGTRGELRRDPAGVAMVGMLDDGARLGQERGALGQNAYARLSSIAGRSALQAARLA